MPVGLLKAAARASGGAGINDVYLTALGHAIAGWASTAWPRAARTPSRTARGPYPPAARLLGRLVAASTAPGRLTLAASFLVMRKRLRYGERGREPDRSRHVLSARGPLAVVMLVYAGEASLCFRIDEALPGADTLPGLWRQALEELSTAGRPTISPGAATTAGATPAPGRSVE
ncbi:hypothetical protein ACWD1Z_34940 [Streptomyces sp. NPDC002784]